MYDVIIIGGGPAGVAAGVYTGRKKLKTLVIAEEFGGQSVVSAEIENWIGTTKISGLELAKNLEEHLRAQEEVEVKSPERGEKIEKKGDGYIVKTNKREYKTKTVILALGARRRKMEIAGEKEYDGKGVAYCSTCDAPLFKDKKVVVVGAGNAGLEAVEDLLPYAGEIYLLTRGDKMRGDAITLDGIQKSDKFKSVIYNAELREVKGKTFVTGLKYWDKKTDEIKILKVDGIFVEIGSIPNSEIVKDLVDINDRGEIIIDHRTSATSKDGIYAAGDVTDEAYKQNNISVGDGVKAALSAYQYILKSKRT